MNRKGYIGIIALTLYVSLVQGQAVLDTLCVDAIAPSHLAVPYQAGYSYQWNVNGGQIISQPDSNDILVDWAPIPGLYEVSVTISAAGSSCPGDTMDAYIFLRGPNNASGKGPTKVCRGEEVLLTSTIPGNFRWSNGSTDRTISFKAESDTSLYLVAVNGKCTNDTLNYFVEVEDAPVSAMNQLPDTVEINTSVNLYFTGQGSNVEWYLNQGFEGTGSYMLITFDQWGQNYVTQVVSNGECFDTLRKAVFVDDLYTAHFPNAFTPNGDGINDLWTFDGKGHASFVAKIYNRWGEHLHTWTDQSMVDGWDGTEQGQPSKIDSYIYRIEITDLRGRVHHYVNQFSLIR